MPAPAADLERPLWHLVLDWIVGRFEDVLHPLDRAKVVWWMRELYAVGERPTPRQVRAYLRTHHASWRPSDDVVVETWGKIMRNPMHRFRLPPTYRYQRWPYHLTEDLIIDHHLAESLEDRVTRFAQS